MSALIKWFIRFPIWSNVLLGGLFLFGGLGLVSLRSSFFPEAEPSIITVSITWPGASAEEVEEATVQRIEENLRGLEGIALTSSVSQENVASITVEIEDGASISEVTEDVKAAVDRVSPWPSGAEKPLVTQRAFRMRALNIAISGQADPWALKAIAQEFRDALYTTGDISQVSINGYPDREIVVEVNQTELLKHQLTLQQISSAIQTHNIDLSGGTIKTDGEEILIRSYAKESDVERIRRIPIMQLNDGSTLFIDQIAEVREQWSDTPISISVNGLPAVAIDIGQSATENILTVAEKSKDVLKNFQSKYPEVHFDILEDPTILLKGRIQTLIDNGLLGFVLVLIVLTLFLSWRLSFWVALGIPTAFAGMFVVLGLSGITINVISLMGMLVVMGMLVDDAIVTAENIYQKFEHGALATKAAVIGAMEMSTPIFSSVTTTMLAFAPFFFFAGMLGGVIWQLSLVVIAALAFSFIESMLILPPHLAHSKALVVKETVHPVRAWLNKVENGLAQKIYGTALKWSIKHWPFILTIPLAAWFITSGAMAGGIIQQNDFPSIDRDEMTLNIEMIAGTPTHVTDSVLTTLEQVVWDVNQYFKKQRNDSLDVVQSVAKTMTGSTHKGQLEVKLLTGEERNLKTFKIQQEIRRRAPSFAGLSKFSFSAGHWGKAISVSLVSSDLDQLSQAKNLLMDRMKELPEIKDVIDNDVAGLREMRLSLTPVGLALGFTPQNLALQVRQSFFGTEVQKLPRGEDEIRVWTRLHQENRKRISDLENLQLTAPNGSTVYLRDIATWKMERGRVAINHLNGQRELRVEADMANEDDSPKPIQDLLDNKIVPEVLNQVRNVNTALSGRKRQNKLFQESLFRSFPPALVAIFILLILTNRSFPQAMLIIGMIPLGLLGSLWGHTIHGHMVSRMSMFGMVALSGVVINNSIVMIDTINNHLRHGYKLYDAIFQASVSRFRPMLLTTLTTVAGLAPLIFEKSLQAQFLIPLAITIAYGLIGGSLFILFVTPAAFIALNKLRVFWEYFKRFFSDFWSGKIQQHPPIIPEELEPAVIEKKHESMEAWS